MKKQLPYFIAMIFGFFVFSCTPEPEIIIQTETETVTIRDTINVIQTDTIRIVDIDTIFSTVSDDSTVVLILVKHAETQAGGGTNPVLSADGQIRANELARLLQNVELDAIYSTNLSRTIGTANPSSIDQGIPIDIYDGFDMPGFEEQVKAQHKGQTILVSGHSDTTPDLLNLLTNSNDYELFPENGFDRLFFVSLNSLDEASVVFIEYGVDTP